MAIPSRASLRSSSRQSASCSELTATVTHRNTSPATRHEKRPYKLLSTNNSEQVTKRQKLNPQQLPRPKIIPRNHVKKTSEVAPKPQAVTHPELDPLSRSTSAVQPLANGTIITNVEQNRSETIFTKEKSLKEVDKRALRSQDGGSRSKSELSLYFPNYEELISNEPKESGRAPFQPSRHSILRIAEFLMAGTRIFITDDNPKLSSSNSSFTAPYRNAHQPPIAMVNGSSQTSISSVDTVSDLNDAQKLDFSSIEPHTRLHTAHDPLTADLYFKAHRRAERQEKQLRNIEKERAQHEKVQLERILDGLKGHDWLRVMGISGVTDSEKRSFEPKRDWFVREVSSLIEKFRIWKEEEKKRKTEKEQSLMADEDDDEEEEQKEEEEDDDNNNGGNSRDLPTTGPPPDPADLDAWAARQLHQEAISASTTKATRQPPIPQLLPPALEKPFTSFYSKPYIREAALSKHRRGRTRFAFGQPVPDVAERAFELPSGILTEEAIRAAARRGRRVRRGRDSMG
ncbi:hypothetical protein MMC06_002908 [Schaereria dolodes]|nr:hypothetical protein [Schaereria dolodes]